ncbi:MAG: class I SAM-dependent methyltransferase [Pyrinomonadaceae bacterium]|nr:class I SAM-dependent methyltransferase [Pyrinomonadaceae bacterium]
MSKIQKTWEHFGEENPYFAVVTLDQFEKENLSEDVLAEFFESGSRYTETVWKEIETNLVSDFRPKRSLDFGCGVGRLSIPIARRSGELVAVDISKRMLEEAERNAVKANVNNISFVQSDDNISRVSGKFDFIHSFIVIQHIDPSIGETIFEKMIEKLEDGGIGALHLTYDHPGKRSSVLKYNLYMKLPFVFSLRNLLLQKKQEPLIPVHTYDLNKIFRILQRNGCHKCFVRFSDHGHWGIHLFFLKDHEIIF